jgi:soluble lytic murein transglycosylase-like protein
MKRLILACLFIAILCNPVSTSATRYSSQALYDQERPIRKNTSQSVPEIVAAAARYAGVPVKFALSIAKHESHFDCGAVGAAGERGVMQIKPATARGIGYKGPKNGLNDCRTGVYWGMKYLKMAINKADGDLHHAAFLYNAGLGAKTKHPARKPYVIAVFRKKDLTE